MTEWPDHWTWRDGTVAPGPAAVIDLEQQIGGREGQAQKSKGLDGQKRPRPR